MFGAVKDVHVAHHGFPVRRRELPREFPDEYLMCKDHQTYVAMSPGFWGMYLARLTSPVCGIDCMTLTLGCVSV